MEANMYVIVGHEPESGRVRFITEFHHDSRRAALLEMAALLFDYRAEGRAVVETSSRPVCYAITGEGSTLMLELLCLPNDRARLDEHAAAFFSR